MITVVFAEADYPGIKLKDALRHLSKWTIAFVKRSDSYKGFEVLRRRGVVERTRRMHRQNRRIAKEREQAIASATAWLFTFGMPISP